MEFDHPQEHEVDKEKIRKARREARKEKRRRQDDQSEMPETPKAKRAKISRDGPQQNGSSDEPKPGKAVASSALNIARSHQNGDTPKASKPRKDKAPRREPRPGAHIDLNAVQNSPFWSEVRSFYLPLSPIASQYPLQGLCAEHFTPLVLTYYRPMRGVILAYQDEELGVGDTDEGVEITSHVSRQINEYAASYIWVTADFTVYRPEPGMWIEGYVIVQNEGHLGLLVLNYFNATVESRRLPKSWRWTGPSTPVKPRDPPEDVEMRNGVDETEANDMQHGASGATVAEGHWIDGYGMQIEGVLRFRVRDWIVSRAVDRERGVFGIEGTLLTEEEERRETELQRSSVVSQ